MRRPAPTFVYAPPRKPPRGREPKRTALLDVYEAQEKLHEIMDDSFKRKVQHDPKADQLARSLGMPGAGYAIEIGERLLTTRRKR